MIKNKESIIEKIKFSLSKERTFHEVDYSNLLLEDILKDVSDVDIFYIYSPQAINCVKPYNESSIIVWDVHYWDFYKDYLFQAENCRINKYNQFQGIVNVYLKYLSEKYCSLRKISNFLLDASNRFPIPMEITKKQISELSIYLNIAEVFSLYHELGHLKYKKSDDIILQYKDSVMDLFSALSDDDFAPLNEWSDLGKTTTSLLVNSNVDNILEEIVADVYAAIELAKYFLPVFNNDPFFTAQKCLIAIEHISTFQNMFNAVNEAWNGHYIQMKYHSDFVPRTVNPYFNELAMARNALGSLVICVILMKSMGLTEEQKNKIWSQRDELHIEIEDVINYLTDDEFITTLIDEALS